MQSPVTQRFVTRESVIGAGTVIRRALPNQQLRTVGAWCFLDHVGPVRFPAGHGLHIGPHPHIGLQTFTWLMEGEILHRDSLGCEQLIRAGQVNLMTAGKGVVHSEDSARDGDVLHAAQLWIALPDSHRQCEPAFRHYPDLPVVQQDGFRITVLVGTAAGRTSPVQVCSPLVGLDVCTSSPARTQIALDPAFEHAVLVLRGEAGIGNELLAVGTLLHLGTGRKSVEIVCADAMQLLVLGGAPFEEPLLVWWNLVGRTPEDIRQAVDDWNAQNGRFPLVPGAVTSRELAPLLDMEKLLDLEKLRQRG